jgi:hypothetical protein
MLAERTARGVATGLIWLITCTQGFAAPLATLVVAQEAQSEPVAAANESLQPQRIRPKTVPKPGQKKISANKIPAKGRQDQAPVQDTSRGTPSSTAPPLSVAPGSSSTFAGAGPPAPGTPPASAPVEKSTAAAMPPVAPTPQMPALATGEFQPVLHARDANISTCMDTILGESATVIDSQHAAISTWAKLAPNESVFQSIIGLSYANKAAPNGAAVILAAPVGPSKCEGLTVQIYPFAQTCSAIQATLVKDGHTIATLTSLPVVQTKNGFRDILLPTAGGGCVVVAVGLRG